MSKTEHGNRRLELLRRIEALQREGNWNKSTFQAALVDAIAIDMASGNKQSNLEWLYNEARGEWLDGA